MLRYITLSVMLAMGLCAYMPVAVAAMGSAQAKKLAIEAEHGNAHALEALQKQAVTGDASAQKAMGDLYKHGQAVKRDYAKAATWYRKAAEHGLASAQAELGFLYYRGQGVQRDYAAAAAWWGKAARQDDASAQANLGVLYFKGQGVSQDYAKATELWRGAAEQGDAPSQYNIGFAYYQGQGVPRNFVAAYKWLGLAALYGRGGLRDAAAAARDALAQQMTPAQLLNAQQLMKAWRPRQ